MGIDQSRATEERRSLSMPPWLFRRLVLAEVLAAEIDDRAERRRTGEAKFPRVKRLSEFNIDAPNTQPAQPATLAGGGYIDAGEAVVLLGDSCTGKTHLLIGLGLAAWEHGI